MSLLSLPVFSQGDKEPKALGLPGDNLDLYAVLDLFQKSKTIEDFESSLNSEKQGINNLDLDNDKKIDFIKAVTKKENDSYTIILQDPVSKTETQDVAVILVAKDKNKKVTLQIVGDEALYGKNYIVEPAPAATTSVTPNPAYVGTNPVAAAPQVVVVESSPVIVYLYSPVYVPYVPPYYYGFYPPYFHPWAPVYFSMYYHHVYHHHAYYQNTVIIRSPNYAHYSSSYRSTSVTVNNYNKNGNYKGTYQGNTYKKPTTLPSNASSLTSNANRAVNTQTTNRAANTTSLPSNVNKSNVPQGANRQQDANIQSAKANAAGKRRR
ncbi:hypothetical protein CLU81_5152 [Flavobacterium sp. 9]|nr:hypothetical protein CLU81_5152 [Flavobacterium sp. 9]